MAALSSPFLFSAPGADSAGLAVRAQQALGRAQMAWLMPPMGGNWGPNLEYSPEFLALQALVAGRPETQFQVAEPPDWLQVIAHAESLLERSRDLRVLMWWLIAQLHVTGLAALPFGLEVLRQWVEQGWPLLNPPLDAEDANPMERLHVLEELVRGESFWKALRQAKVLELPAFGAVEFRHMVFALEHSQRTPLPNEPALTRSQLVAARHSHPEAVLALQAVIQSSCLALSALKQALSAQVPALSTPDFSALFDCLNMVLTLWPPASVEGDRPDGLTGRIAEGAFGGAIDGIPSRVMDLPQTGSGTHGVITSRPQALEAIAAVCQYLEQAEPTSPAQWLLKRAARLIDMNFIALMNELAPNALSDVARIMGVNPRDVLDPDDRV